jgi:hypothetical protein
MAEETFEITAEGAAALGALTQAFNPRAAEPGIAGVALKPDETWKLEGGTAWVWRVPGAKTLTRPVIIADGFSGGASSLKEWDGLWAGSEIADIYPWGTQLHEEGRDVIVLGYNSRCAPIHDNAKVATQCILKAAQERSGNAPLVVGGLSMGGLVTRYALASLEPNAETPRWAPTSPLTARTAARGSRSAFRRSRISWRAWPTRFPTSPRTPRRSSR